MGSFGGIAFLRHLDPVPKLPILVPQVNGFGIEGNRTSGFPAVNPVGSRFPLASGQGQAG
jgi:hypothetical protein